MHEKLDGIYLNLLIVIRLVFNLNFEWSLWPKRAELLLNPFKSFRFYFDRYLNSIIISYADYFQISDAHFIKANNSLGIRFPNPNYPNLNGYWKASKNDMAMATSTFPNGNQMKSIMNRLEIIENEIRSIKASLDYQSNDYTYTDD